LAKHVKVYAYVLHKDRVSNLKRAQIDDVVVKDEYSSELLAGYVTVPGLPQMISMLLGNDKNEHEICLEEIPAEFIGKTCLDYWMVLRSERNCQFLGLVSEEEVGNLSNVIKGGDPYINEFIKEQMEIAGLSTKASSEIRLQLNPSNHLHLQAHDFALILKSKNSEHKVAQA